MCQHAFRSIFAVSLSLLAASSIQAWATMPEDREPSSIQEGPSDVTDEQSPIETPQRNSPGTTYTTPFVITLHDEITEVTLKSLERRIDDALKRGADMIIFDVDTPGGMVVVMIDICTKIKNLGDVYTVAWINPQAYSAGAVIAMACDSIVMSGRSTIGDSQPILITPGGASGVPDEIEAKLTSPLVEEVRDSSRRNGYDMDMCLAMIRPEIEIFWLENTETGERDFVDRATRDEYFGIEPTLAPRKIREKDEDDEGSERVTYRAGQRVPDSMSRTAWQYVKSAPGLDSISQPLVSDRLLLTMSQDEAVAFGFAQAKVSTLEDFRKLYPIEGEFQKLEYTWSEHLVAFLSRPLVRGVLFVLIMMGAYTEFKSPGLGAPGLVAVVALVIFLGAPYMTGMASVVDIIVLIAGVALLCVEIFLIPGFGLAGIAGMLLIVIGVILSFTPSEMPGPIPWPTFNYRYTVQGLWWGLTVVAGGMMTSLLGMALLSRFMPKMPYVGRVVAANPSPADVAPDIAHPFAAHLGDEGIAEGPLRPAGKARFGQALVDVVSEGEFIAAHKTVRVVERRGNRIVVRAV